VAQQNGGVITAANFLQTRHFSTDESISRVFSTRPWDRAGYDRAVPFLLRLLVAWAVDAAALALAAWIFSGISVGGSAGTLLVAALVYGILATFVKPVLKLLTLPLAILTLGIAWFFVAMFILWLTDLIVGGLHISGFWDLVGGTVVVWAVGVMADFWLFPERRVKG
jgi:putative membrane protein